MNQTIQNYHSQTILAEMRRQARKVWMIFLAIGGGWLFLILLAPAAQANEWLRVSASIYNFFGYLCHQISERSFQIGAFPMAVCARCFGFYSGFLLGIVFYPFLRALDNTDSFPRYWLFAAIVPMAIDFSLTFFGIWENTHLSRLLTGSILGAACAFFIIPALVEVRFWLSSKFTRRSINT